MIAVGWGIASIRYPVVTSGRKSPSDKSDTFFDYYCHTLDTVGKQTGLLRRIFMKSQN